MAVQATDPGQLHEFLGILKRRAWQVVLPAAVIVSGGVMVATLLPRKYQVRTLLELRETSLPIGGQGPDVRSFQRDIGAANTQITAFERVVRVIEKLEWEDFQTLSPDEKREYVQRVIKNLRVTANKAQNNEGSSFVTIAYEDADPLRAAEFANALRVTYVQEKVESVRNGARAALQTLYEQMTEDEEAYRAAEKRAAEHKKKHGLAPTPLTRGAGGQIAPDPSFQLLSSVRQQLQTLDIGLAQDTAQAESQRAQHAEAPLEVPRSTLIAGVDVAPNIAVVELDIETLRQQQQRYRPPNSKYKAIQDQIDALEERIALLRGQVRSDATQTELVPNPAREALVLSIQKLETSIAGARAAKARLLEDEKEFARRVAEQAEIFREETMLDGDVARTRTIYDDSAVAYDKQQGFVGLISQPEFNPFEVIEFASGPRRPSSPNVALILGFSLVLGLGLGLASALAAEFGRNAFRGIGDTTRTMALPVLGAVNTIETAAQARQRRVRRALVGSSTSILAGSILWVTWAYTSRPQLLGPDLTRLIDEARAEFR